MPRVTITLPADLHAQVKAEAARLGQTLSQFVTDALREGLQRRRVARESGPARLPTWPGGPRPGVNLDSNAALREHFDDIGEKSWP